MINNIDTIFKKKAEDIPVDTGMMEKDWRAMAMRLAPATPPAVKPAGNMLIKKLFFAVAVTAAVVMIYLLVKMQPIATTAALALKAKKEVKQPPVINKHTAGDTIVIKPAHIKTNNQAARININNLRDSALRKPTASILFDTVANDKDKQHKIILTVKPFIDTPKRIVIITDSAGMKLPVTIIKIKPDADILDSFYNLLKTPTQLFAIDNTRDTTITGKDSSEITIPANCFLDSAGHLVNKNVVIQLDECYSYADIIANKLNTLSNGEALESGGMLQIKAMANNKVLKLNSAKPLLVKMPVKKLDNKMQLFVQQQREPATPVIKRPAAPVINRNSPERPYPGYDTALYYDAMPGINWVAAGQQQSYDNLPLVKVLNLQNEPFNTVYRHGKRIGKFRINKKCTLTKEQIIAELMKRYNYDEIRIRWYNRTQEYTNNVYYWNTQEPVYQYHTGKIYIGDSINVLPSEADKFNLWAPGQKEAYLKKLRKNSVYWQAVSNLEKKYAFTISNLGWINCDHFYNDPRPKVRYAINIQDAAKSYVSQIIFLNCRLAMPAETGGNYISFPNLPEGEPVQLVSIGVKNGKVVACVKNAIVSKEIVSDLQYEEVTVDNLKKQLKASDLK